MGLSNVYKVGRVKKGVPKLHLRALSNMQEVATSRPARVTSARSSSSRRTRAALFGGTGAKQGSQTDRIISTNKNTSGGTTEKKFMTGSMWANRLPDNEVNYTPVALSS